MDGSAPSSVEKKVYRDALHCVTISPELLTKNRHSVCLTIKDGGTSTPDKAAVGAAHSSEDTNDLV